MGSVQVRLPIPYPPNGLMPYPIHPSMNREHGPAFRGGGASRSARRALRPPARARPLARRRAWARTHADIASDLLPARSVCHA